jgi:spore maturation protein CgeB
MLFDYVFVWHLSFVPLYQAAGHPKVFALPHAVDANLFRRGNSWTVRPFDLGWIGEFGYGHYARRRRIIESLAPRFKMNDFRIRYTKEETAAVYSQSKIVVNVSRDDYPSDANMRCYEGMAGGALLITGIPTELTEWGFCEGTHFIGWRNEAEIPDLVDYYLNHEKEATEIAYAGQELTLSNFTFQCCRDKMTTVLQNHQGQFFSPARGWPAEDVCLTYLEYYYRYQLLDATLEEFTRLRNASSRAYRRGLPMVLKTMRHVLGRSLF